jgi:hypothetical protein
VFTGDDGGQLVDPLMQQLAEGEQHGRPPRQGRLPPRPAASAADATARSTSAALAKSTSPVCSPVAGLNTGPDRPDVPGLTAPSIQCEIRATIR